MTPKCAQALKELTENVIIGFSLSFCRKLYDFLIEMGEEGWFVEKEEYKIAQSGLYGQLKVEVATAFNYLTNQMRRTSVVSETERSSYLSCLSDAQNLLEGVKNFLAIFEATSSDPETAKPKSKKSLKNEKKDAGLQRVLQIPIENLNFRLRARNVLARHPDIKTVGDLVRKSEGKISKTKNCGPRTMDEFRQVLADLGLRFGMLEENVEDGKKSSHPIPLSPPSDLWIGNDDDIE